MAKEYRAVEPVPVTIDGKEYGLLFSFGKVKRIRERLKVDLTQGQEVGLDIFTKVLFAGLVDPKQLTEENIDDHIDTRNLPYYIERLQLAISGQTQPTEAVKNDSPAPAQTAPAASGEAQPTAS